MTSQTMTLAAEYGAQRRSAVARGLALLLGFALLMLGIVAGGAPAHAAEGTAVLKGQLTVPNGVDPARVEINVAAEPSPDGAVYSAWAEADGSFEVRDIPAGTFLVTAEEYTPENPDGSYDLLSIQILRPGTVSPIISIDDGEVVTQDFTLRPARATISGDMAAPTWEWQQVLIEEKIDGE